MSGVPFKTNAHAGLAEVDGLMQIKGERLHVDFVIKDAIAGLLRSSHKCAIPLSKVDDIRFQQNWFGGKLMVRVMELDLIASIPWSQGAEFSVKVKSRDRELASDLVEDFTWSEPSITIGDEPGDS